MNRSRGEPGGNLHHNIARQVGGNALAGRIKRTRCIWGQRGALEGEDALPSVERSNRQLVVCGLAIGDGPRGRAGGHNFEVESHPRQRHIRAGRASNKSEVIHQALALLDATTRGRGPEGASFRNADELEALLLQAGPAAPMTAERKARIYGSLKR